MATFYFNGYTGGTGTGYVDEVGNYYNNVELTDPAGSLPTETDDIVVCSEALYGSIQCRNLSFKGNFTGCVIDGANIAVTGTLTWNGYNGPASYSYVGIFVGGQWVAGNGGYDGEYYTDAQFDPYYTGMASDYYLDPTGITQYCFINGVSASPDCAGFCDGDAQIDATNTCWSPTGETSYNLACNDPTSCGNASASYGGYDCLYDLGLGCGIPNPSTTCLGETIYWDQQFTTTTSNGNVCYASNGLDAFGQCCGNCNDLSACDEDLATGNCIYLDCNNSCSATALSTFGCTDPTACNYDEYAGCDDGSCIKPSDDCHNCDGSCGGVNGCVDNGCGCGNPAPIDNCHDCNNDCICPVDCLGNCDGIAYSGCTDSSACNYDSGATCDDGSCYWGCTDPSARNYHSYCDNCWYTDCADYNACNYDSNSFGYSECINYSDNCHDGCGNCICSDCGGGCGSDYDNCGNCNGGCGFDCAGGICGCQIGASYDYFGNYCCDTDQSPDFFGNTLCSGYTGTCTDTANACGEDNTGCLYYACNGNCSHRTPTLYPNCPQPSVQPSVLVSYKVGALPVPANPNNPALKNVLLAQNTNFPLIIQAR